LGRALVSEVRGVYGIVALKALAGLYLPAQLESDNSAKSASLGRIDNSRARLYSVTIQKGITRKGQAAAVRQISRAPRIRATSNAATAGNLDAVSADSHGPA
jgi:hypothetical protein